MDRISAQGEAPQQDVLPPAPHGVDARAWTGIIGTPPILPNNTIVPHQIWGQAINMLLADPSPDTIAAFNSSSMGKAAGNDGAAIVQGLTGRAPTTLTGKPENVGVQTPPALAGKGPPPAQTEYERENEAAAVRRRNYFENVKKGIGGAVEAIQPHRAPLSPEAKAIADKPEDDRTPQEREILRKAYGL
jgi:hypothetical protein